MYRLRVVPIFLPPLRDRWEDVEVLLWHFIARHNEAGRRQVETVSPEAMRALIDHRWPGNVRELANVVAYAFAVGRGTGLELDDLPPELQTPGPGPRVEPVGPGAGRSADRVAEASGEGAYATGAGGAAGGADSAAAGGGADGPEPDAARAERVRAALAAEGGHLGRAAKRLGISRATLWRWRKHLGL